MRGYHSTVVLGNVVRDVEITTTTTGKEVAKFTLAVNNDWTDKNGEKRENTTYYNVEAWGGMAKLCSNIHKGNTILVSGVIKTGEYTNAEGRKVKTWCVNPQSIHPVNSPTRDMDRGELPNGIKKTYSKPSGNAHAGQAYGDEYQNRPFPNEQLDAIQGDDDYGNIDFDSLPKGDVVIPFD